MKNTKFISSQYTAIFLVTIFTFAQCMVGAQSVSAKNTSGLMVSPSSASTQLDAGSSKTSYFKVTNVSNKRITVTPSVKNFSVDAYTYNYKFQTPNQTWITFHQSEIVLGPNETAKVMFDITVPKQTAPGGYYFSLFASAIIPQSSTPATIQATSLLYITVNGQLVRTSVLQDSSKPLIVTGSTIPYSFDVKNTGNVYFSAYFFGTVDSIFGKSLPDTSDGHVIIPGAIRSIHGEIPSPILPGLYRVTYGYKVDFANIITSNSGYIIYLPPWSIAGGFLVVLMIIWVLQSRRKTSK